MIGDPNTIERRAKEKSGAVLFLHGFPGMASDWANLQNNLKVQSIAPDMPWIESAQVVSPPGVIDIAGRIARFISQRYSTPPLVVGHDLGAVIGWWLARLAPDLLCAFMAIACPAPGAYARSLDKLESGGRRAYLNALLSAAADEPLDVEAHLRSAPSKIEIRRHLQDALGRTRPDFIRELYGRSLTKTSVQQAAAFPKLNCPVHLVYGDQDPYFPESLMSLSARVAGEQVAIHRVPGAGHFLHLTHDDAVQEAIMDSIQRVGVFRDTKR